MTRSFTRAVAASALALVVLVATALPAAAYTIKGDGLYARFKAAPTMAEHLHGRPDERQPTPAARDLRRPAALHRAGRRRAVDRLRRHASARPTGSLEYTA